MSSKIIISCIQNILPVFSSNIKHGLKQKNHTILTNKYINTLFQYKSQIEEIKRLRNCQFVYSFESALGHLKNHQTNNQTNHKDKANNNSVVLLVGNVHHDTFHRKLKGLKIITVEQMCSIFPQKVPLSYRSRDVKEIRHKVEQRLGMSLQNQPSIHQILLTNWNNQMWDQSIQIILDNSSSSIIAQYIQVPHFTRNKFYKLTMNDFIAAIKTCHQKVHQCQLPHLVDLNTKNRHIDWIIQETKKKNPNAYVIVDQDLVDDRSVLVEQLIEVERVDENSQLWY